MSVTFAASFGIRVLTFDPPAVFKRLLVSMDEVTSHPAVSGSARNLDFYQVHPARWI